MRKLPKKSYDSLPLEKEELRQLQRQLARPIDSYNRICTITADIAGWELLINQVLHIHHRNQNLRCTWYTYDSKDHVSFFI